MNGSQNERYEHTMKTNVKKKKKTNQGVEDVRNFLDRGTGRNKLVVESQEG